MARSEQLGIKRLEDYIFVVNDIERSTKFYTEKLDFAETQRSTAAQEALTGEHSRVFQAGQCRVTVVQPLRPDSNAGRYLSRHPDGITTLIFEVKDVEATFKVLEERRATIVADIVWHEQEGGRFGYFDITTPFGEGRFRFLERQNWQGPDPGFEERPLPASFNRFGFDDFDHVTSNFLTLRPMVLWCKDVLGLEEYWDIAFHTDDAAEGADTGSGLKSTVMWDPHSGVKFANNEPQRPQFEDSQIYTFVVDNKGEGFQHVAITTPKIIETVRDLKEAGVSFMPTPGHYYDYLPTRMENLGVGKLDEDIEVLRELEILVDGKGPGHYLLQIFLQEASGLYDDPSAGPFFYEIIQRKGDKGFGAGNFRALFESIEFAQKKQR